MGKQNYHICNFEKMGVAVTRPYLFYATAPVAPVARISRNQH